MSLFGELIRTLVEAVEESQNQGRPKPVPPAAPARPKPVASVDRGSMRDDMPGAETPALPPSAPAPGQGPHPYDLIKAQQRLRQAHEQQVAGAEANAATQARAKRRPPSERSEAVPVTAPSGPDAATRLGRLLRQPQTMREVLLLKELLDPPVSLRPPRR